MPDSRFKAPPDPKSRQFNSHSSRRLRKGWVPALLKLRDRPEDNIRELVGLAAELFSADVALFRDPSPYSGSECTLQIGNPACRPAPDLPAILSNDVFSSFDKPITLSDFAPVFSEAWDCFRQSGLVDGLFQPVRLKKSRCGVLALAFSSLQQFTDEDIAQLSALAGQISLQDRLRALEAEQRPAAGTAARTAPPGSDAVRPDGNGGVAPGMDPLLHAAFDMLRQTRLTSHQAKLLEVVERNLGFHVPVSSKLKNLSPAEISVASLIKQQKSNKEIARALRLSIRTVEVHRNNIRHKLNLKNKGVNLRSYLLTLD